MEKAMTALDFLSQDAEVRRLYEARQKGIRDYNSAIARATQEGREEGREEGEVDRTRAIARRMVAADEPIEKIVQFTGLTKKDIEAL